MGQDDRRKYQRNKKQSVISFHIITEDGTEKTRKALVVDGSQGGVRFRSDESISKNTKLYIKLDSEDWGNELTYYCKDNGLGLVEMIGSVMWCLENDETPHNRTNHFNQPQAVIFAVISKFVAPIL